MIGIYKYKQSIRNEGGYGYAFADQFLSANIHLLRGGVSGQGDLVRRQAQTAAHRAPAPCRAQTGSRQAKAQGGDHSLPPRARRIIGNIKETGSAFREGSDPVYHFISCSTI